VDENGLAYYLVTYFLVVNDTMASVMTSN